MNRYLVQMDTGTCGAQSPEELQTLMFKLSAWIRLLKKNNLFVDGGLIDQRVTRISKNFSSETTCESAISKNTGFVIIHSKNVFEAEVNSHECPFNFEIMPSFEGLTP